VSEVALRDFVPGRDDAAVEALWGRCFGRPKGGQTVAWLFREGPVGPCPRSVAELDGRMVAHAGVAVLRFQIAGGEGLAGYSVGAMTDPAVRGRGLFVRTAEHLYQRLAQSGFALVAGFSNARSARLHTQQLGRTPIRPFPWCVRVLRPVGAGLAIVGVGRSASRTEAPLAEWPSSSASSGVRVEPCSPDDPRIDAVWEQARREIVVGAVRDAAYARWRYASRPDAGYRAGLALREGRPVGWAVARLLPLRGLRAAFLLDLLADPEDRAAGTALLDAIDVWARAAGAHVVSALRPGHGAVRALLARRHYLPIPERLHPQTIRFSVKGFGRFASEPRLTSPEAWWLSWGDTDVV
jgi:GNAT superfamily N-acetyltransferase